MRTALTWVGVAMLVALAEPAFGQQGRKSGDWAVEYSDGLQLASTSNASGNSFGVACTVASNSCVAFVTLSDTNCTKGNSVPMLMNSPVGSSGMKATCTHLDGKPPLKLMVLDDFESAVSAIESGGEIGFAFPLRGGKFEVYRFSTAGAVAALREARTPPSQRDAVPVRSGPRNQVL